MFVTLIPGVVTCDYPKFDQSLELLKLISPDLVQNCLELFDDITKDKEKYKIFYELFESNLKLGVLEDTTNRNQLSNLVRYRTSDSEEKIYSLTEYVSRMPRNQVYIYYTNGDAAEEGPLT